MDDGHGAPAPEPSSMFQAGVALVAARYETVTFGGDYQGVVPTVAWQRGRFSASATAGLYRLTSNGAEYYGLGDVTLAPAATVYTSGPTTIGVMLPVMLPSGDRATGFGMGHVMVMPMASATTALPRVEVGASLGFGRALGGMESHHDHGPWPLVEPMNMQEVMWSANAYVPLARALRAGVRMSGGIPVGGMGTNRVIGGIRTQWTAGNVETGFEVQVGIAGDPFKLRGLVESAVHF